MRQRLFVFFVLLACVAVVTPLAAQTTGSLSGNVTAKGAALPGVTVTATSPRLQGKQVAITSSNGSYTFPALPPGDYVITFAIAGFKTLEYPVKINVAQGKALDAKMYPEAITEEISVTGSYETVSTSSQGSSTMEADTIEKLPVARTPTQAVALSAGTASTGPGGNISIAGAQSWENLYTLNGVVLNENIRGQPFNMFIEDAIQETTTMTSGVSAEYGRFGGGVVNVVTKSGGNDFSGSFRASFTNDKWTSPTPQTTSQIDEVNEIYEGTVGGYILRDKLWFFGAGRSRKVSGSAQTFGPAPTEIIQFGTGEEEKRYELKLTASLTQNHRIVGNYIKIDRDQTNDFFDPIPPMDLGPVDPTRSLPLEGWAFNYNGVITDNFFIEAQYSKRDFSFVGSGGNDRSIGGGTPVWDLLEGGLFHAPLFCGVCSDEERNNENYLAKASWFLSTESLGTHDIVFGYDAFDDIRKADNWQSASGYILATFSPQDFSTGTPMIDVGPFGAYIIWGSVLQEARESHFKTKSIYVNDSWRLNKNLTFNLGIRYDQSDGTDEGGAKVVDDSRVSPRVGASWDILGNGEWIVNAAFGRYVTAITQNQGDAGSQGGQPTWAGYFYNGPHVSALDLGSNSAALDAIFDWFFNVYGGPSNGDLRAWADIPGLSPKVDKNLGSPYGDEYSIGLTKRLGTRGVVRVDYVRREYGDFYSSEIVPNRSVTDPAGIAGTLDLALIKNENTLLSRSYDGLLTRFEYRLGENVQLGANWTWSKAYGNFNGETGGSGPVSSAVREYQEYKDPSWNSPKGDLGIDQRHKINAWLIWDAISTPHHRLSVSVLENFFSGTPYSASGDIPESVLTDVIGDPADLGYAGSPGDVTYFFSKRGAFTTDDITSTDIAVNYSFLFDAWGRQIEVYIQPEILNVFNQQGVVDVNSTILTCNNSSSLECFDPFSETPVEGVNWEKGSRFGQPVNEDDYQRPRTFRFSLGFRF